MARGSFAAAPMKRGKAAQTKRGLVTCPADTTVSSAASMPNKVTGIGSRAAIIMAMPATAAKNMMMSSQLNTL